MENSLKLISDLTVFSKYSSYLPKEKRRQTFKEIVDEYLSMMKDFYPDLSEQIDIQGKLIYKKRIMPAMRQLQFAGNSIKKNNAKGYNCFAHGVSPVKSFSDTMFLLLSGTGVGYSVEKRFTKKLPKLVIPSESQKYLIADSIEGWADAIGQLVGSYYGENPKPIFDYQDIRAQGELIKSNGSKAPGAEPLKKALEKIENILHKAASREYQRSVVSRFIRKPKLKSIEIHDIMCFIAEAVLAGGVRRSAMIALFDHKDQDMLNCKSGNWWEENGQRAMANNTAKVSRKWRVSYLKNWFFNTYWPAMIASNSGEPGIMWTNNMNLLTNPCAEISLRDGQFCNLTTINAEKVNSLASFKEAVYAATFFGTLQAGISDFHYIDTKTIKNSKEERLLGVSITGIYSQNIQDEWFKIGSEYANIVNKHIAKQIGIKSSARVTTIKPEGTASLVLETSSGAHPWHDKFYIRRSRFNKMEPIASYLAYHMPELCEQDQMKENQIVFGVPVKAPDGAITRNEVSALDHLQKVKFLHENWIKPGHNSGDNTHNVSVTINYKENEIESVRDWMWYNRDSYTAISLLPHSDHTYVQAPYESITEEKYNHLIQFVKPIELASIVEEENNTDLQMALACVGGACELSY